jgi:hypothetical protein
MGNWIIASQTTAALHSLAANVIDATCAITGTVWANLNVALWGGDITLPPDTAHVKEYLFTAVGPNKQAYELGRLWGPFTPGAVLSYSMYDPEIPQGDLAVGGWQLVITAYDDNWQPAENPKVLTDLTIGAATITDLTGQDVNGARWLDPGGALHAVVNITATVSSVPRKVTLWTRRHDGTGTICHGWFDFTAATQTFPIGRDGSTTILYPPTLADEQWEACAANGIYPTDSDVPAGAIVSQPFTMPAPAILSPDLIKNAQVIPDPVTGGLRYAMISDRWNWNFYEIDWQLPNVIGELDYAAITVQKGGVIGGVWTPAPDAEGQDHRQFGDSKTLGYTTAGALVKLTGDAVPDWTMPTAASPYNTFRLKIYAYSKRGMDENGGVGTGTLQNCWPGGAGHYDMVPQVPAVATVVVKESVVSRYQDQNGGLHTKVTALFTMANGLYPQVVTLWLDKGDGYGPRWQQQFTVPSGTQSFVLDEWVPTGANQTWTPLAAAGAWNSDTPPTSGVVQGDSFTVLMPHDPVPTEASGAYIDAVSYALGSGGSYLYGWPHLYCTLPLDDPEFYRAYYTIQTGSLPGGVWTPGGQRPVETEVAGWNTDYLHGENMSRVGVSNTIYDHNPNWWTVPSDANLVVRFKWYVVTRRNDGTAITQQSCWSTGVGVATPGTADHQDLTLDPTKAKIDASTVNSATKLPVSTVPIGAGMTTSGGNLIPNLGTGVSIDVNSTIKINLGSGLYNNGGNVAVNTGNGIANNGSIYINVGVGISTSSGPLNVITPANSGVTVDSNGVKVNTGNGLSATGGPLTIKTAPNQGLATDPTGVGVVVNGTAGVKADSNGLSIVVNMTAGMKVDSNGVAANVGAGLTAGIQITIGTGNIKDSMIETLDVSKLTVTGTLTVGAGGIELFGTGDMSVRGGGSIYIDPGFITSTYYISSPVGGAGVAAYRVGSDIVIDRARTGDFTSLKIGGYTKIDSSYNIWGNNIHAAGLVDFSGGTSSSATAGGAGPIPSLPDGYINVQVAGANKRIPYYAV